MRKRVLRVLGLLACLGLLLGLFVLWPARPGQRINRASYERIKAGGMTFSEVQNLLGGPPGDYQTGEVELDLREPDRAFDNVMSAPEVLLGTRHLRHEWWQGDEGTLWVCFDEDDGDRAIVTTFTPGVPQDRGLLARLRRWLGRKP
jgi:hypothetical protein